jgi:DNA replicative helicase MCM subunit Mcm2 (Cdc46/Mcm family)
MFQREAVQIWFCFFYRFLKTKSKKNQFCYKLKRYFLIKIEQIVKINGLFAAKILIYPQKLVSIIKYADKKIDRKKIFQRNSIFSQKKVLILFDHIFKKFSPIFSPKCPSLCPNLIGKLVFIQGFVVNEGPVLIKKFERNLKKHQMITSRPAQIDFQDQSKSFINSFCNLEPKAKYSGIETQNIKIMTKFKNSIYQNKFKPTFIIVSLVGKMVEIKKNGKKVNLWGIVQKKNKSILNKKKNQHLSLVVEAVSIFLEKRRNLNGKILKKMAFPLLDFLLLSCDSKIKGNELNFIKKIVSEFLSDNYTEILKTLILFSLLGGCSKKNLLKINRNSINICFFQNCLDAQYEFFYQIQKISRNSAYISIRKNSIPSLFLDGKKISFFLNNKKGLEPITNQPWFFFIDHIEYMNNKDYNFLSSIILKKSLEFFFKNTKLRVKKPFSVLTFVNFTHFFSNFEASQNYHSNEVIKLFSLFDIITYFPTYMSVSNNHIVPFLFSLKYTDKKNKNKNLENFFANKKARSFSRFNLSRYLFFLKSFKSPLFSSGVEKLLVCWYLSDFNGKQYSEIKIIFLEKLIKFSQASAKLFNRDVVLLIDGMFAISIIERLYLKFKIKNNKENESESIIFHKNRVNKILKRYKMFEILKSFHPTNICNSNLT